MPWPCPTNRENKKHTEIIQYKLPWQIKFSSAMPAAAIDIYERKKRQIADWLASWLPYPTQSIEKCCVYIKKIGLGAHAALRKNFTRCQTENSTTIGHWSLLITKIKRANRQKCGNKKKNTQSFWVEQNWYEKSSRLGIKYCFIILYSIYDLV